MDYVIVMDVAGDINPEIAKENDIRFIPMEYTVGNTIQNCNGLENEETLAKFYEGQRKGDLTRTSQISPYMYEEFIKNIFEEGKSVLYLCLSSGLSGTYQSACIAKQMLKDEYPNVSLYPLDTLAATGGMGVLAQRAIRNKKSGMSIEENYADVSKAVKKIKHWFMVDDLEYLKRGGRISAASALIGTALSVKPILTVNSEGKLDTVSKTRGYKTALKELHTRFSKDFDYETNDTIYICHSDNGMKAQMLYEMIQSEYPDKPICICGLSPIIGAHTGPDLVAVCFIGK